MKQKLVEIARSFSRKLNLGKYETADFFCSQKMEVPEKKAIKASEELFEFCKDEVMKSVYAYQLENMAIEPTQPAKITYADIKEAQKDAPQAQAEQEKANEIPPEPEEANIKADEMLTSPEAELPAIET